MNNQIRRKLRSQGHVFVETENSTENSQAEKPFFKWYWENVLGYSSEEYYREYWREVHCGHTIGPKPKVFRPSLQGVTMGNVYDGFEDTFLRFMIGTIPAIFYYLIRQSIRKYIQRLQRPTYYERERDRRIELGRQRRAITLRTTKNVKPTVDEIRAAWNGARHSPEGALRLGGMLEDLECFVCNLTIGNAVEGYHGRRGGIKRFLQDKAPDLFEHYAALMRYKSIARRFRQACGLVDPYPASAVIPMSSPPRVSSSKTSLSGVEASTATPSTSQTASSSSKASSSQVVSPSSKSSSSQAVSSSSMSSQPQDIASSSKSSSSQEVSSSARSSQAQVASSLTTAVSEVATQDEGKICSEQIKRTDEVVVGEGKQGEGKKGEGKQGEGMKGEGKKDEGKNGEGKKGEGPLKGVKSWVMDGFVFANNGYWVEREAFEVSVRVLKACENSVISLEAALALEIDPNCLTTAFARMAADKEKRDQGQKRGKNIRKQGMGEQGVGDNGVGELGSGRPGVEISGVGMPVVMAQDVGENGVGKNSGGRIVPNKSSNSGSGMMEGNYKEHARGGEDGVSRRVLSWLKRRCPVASVCSAVS